MEQSNIVRELPAPAGIADEKAVRGRYDLLTRRLIALGKTITFMESCTGGQLSSLITDTEGSSAVLKGALVTYSNEAKLLHGVPEEVLTRWGVYSPQTACAMARAALQLYRADLAVGVTGSFGNVDPNNPDSVPGEVYFAVATPEDVRAYHLSVPPQPTRLHYKLCMADAVAGVLFASLGL